MSADDFSGRTAQASQTQINVTLHSVPLKENAAAPMRIFAHNSYQFLSACADPEK